MNKKCILAILIIIILAMALSGCNERSISAETIEGTFKNVVKKSSGWITVTLEDKDSNTKIDFCNLKNDYWMSVLNSHTGEKIKISYEITGSGFAGPVRNILKVEKMRQNEYDIEIVGVGEENDI